MAALSPRPSNARAAQKNQIREFPVTKSPLVLLGIGVAVALGAVATETTTSKQDRYSLKVPGGLAFSEFRGYDTWEVIGVSNGGKLAVILGNAAMIDALKAGYPDNGKPVPDGAKMAKIHWNAEKSATDPGQPLVPGALHDVDFMAKDAKRFSDSGGWGYAQFEYDPGSDTFRPGTTTDQPPQANDAKCGFACHTVAAKRDYVFTRYPKR
jgi:Cytochrome P460